MNDATGSNLMSFPSIPHERGQLSMDGRLYLKYLPAFLVKSSTLIVGGFISPELSLFRLSLILSI